VYVALWARGFFFEADGAARRRIGGRLAPVEAGGTVTDPPPDRPPTSG
jgi:hypothetical protein